MSSFVRHDVARHHLELVRARRAELAAEATSAAEDAELALVERGLGDLLPGVWGATASPPRVPASAAEQRGLVEARSTAAVLAARLQEVPRRTSSEEDELQVALATFRYVEAGLRRIERGDAPDAERSTAERRGLDDLVAYSDFGAR